MVASTDVVAPAESAPSSVVGPVAWMRTNLFSSWTNTLLTIVGILIAYKTVAAIIQWGILDATFVGADGSACTREGAGACWPFRIASTRRRPE